MDLRQNPLWLEAIFSALTLIYVYAKQIINQIILLEREVNAYCGLGICVITVVVVAGHRPKVAVGNPYKVDTSNPCKPRSSLKGYDRAAAARGAAVAAAMADWEATWGLACGWGRSDAAAVAANSRLYDNAAAASYNVCWGVVYCKMDGVGVAIGIICAVWWWCCWWWWWWCCWPPAIEAGKGYGA